MIGTYAVDEAAKTIVIQIEGCSFPNWNGTNRKSTFNIYGDDISTTSVSSARSIGMGTAHLVWRRIK